MVLSVPQTLSLFDKFLPNKSLTDGYKNVLLRGLLFSIIFVLVAKQI